MKFRSLRNVFASSNNYVCLSCRLRLPSTNLQIQRHRHADAQPSNSQPELLPAQVSGTSPQSSTKEDSNSLPLDQGGQSKGALSSSTSGRKIPLKSPRRPTPEAEKLQRLLHDKFVAQRCKDALSLQFPEEVASTSTALLSKRAPEKEKKISRAGRKREAKREMRKAPIQQSTVGEDLTQRTVDSLMGAKDALLVKPSPGHDKSNDQSTIKPHTSGSSSTPPAVARTARKKMPQKDDDKFPAALSTYDSAKEVEDGDTGGDGLAGAGKPPGHEQTLDASVPAQEDSKIEELHKKPPKVKKKKPGKLVKGQKTSTSDKSRRKARKPYVLKVRRLPSQGPDMSIRPIKDSQASNDPEALKSVRRIAKGGKLASHDSTTDIQNLDARELKISALDLDQPPVPNLSYGLERVLFNPGVYHLQDPRSRVYNFDPYLQSIMPVAEFNFDALKEYITSSRDTALRDLAESYNKRYVGSSSSMTSVLAHFHFLLSQWRSINTTMLSREFPEAQATKFTEIQRNPSAIFLKWRNGSYAIDADKEFASANVLMLLGKSMEKLLTLNTEDFEKYRKSNPGRVSAEEQNAPEAYHYSTMGDFIMRSQLDAHDHRLPGTGMFDLKTRAVVSVRMDAINFEQGAGYQIKSRQGAWESFEREYFDMIRSAFLKYSLQVRMGRMDGIFVAFHNTDRIFGFQYISLAEMDSTLHGQWDTTLGDQEFKLSISLLNDILNKATKKYPNTSLRLHFETREAQTPFMYIFAEPVTEEQITAIQTANDAKIHDFEQEIFGNKRDSTNGEAEDQGWENLQANVQDAMDEDIRDPNHDDGRLDLDPVIATPDHTVTSKHLSSEGTSSVGSDDGSTAAAIEDDDHGEADEEADEDEEDEDEEDEDEEDEDEEDEDEEDEDEEDEDDEVDQDDDGMVPEGILVNNAVGQDPEGQMSIGKDTGAPQLEQSGSDNNVEDADAEGKVEMEMEAQMAGRGEESADNVTENEGMMESDDGYSSQTANAKTGKSEATKDPMQDSGREAKREAGEPDGDDGAPSGDEFPTGADVPFIERISQAKADGRPEGKEVLAMTLTVRNKVNNGYVLRPENFSGQDAWSVEYALEEVSNADRAWSLYQACQMRRKKKADEAKIRGETDDEVDVYIRRLRELSRKGAEWRKQQDETDKALPVKMLGLTFPQGSERDA